MSTAPRRTRSDALQNRDRLLEIAARAFAEQGPQATPAAIAKQAGVGVGTLYRHFPTREALLVAAHSQQIARVCEKATDLAARCTAAEATRAWLEHFLDHAMANSNMCAALNAALAPDVDPYAHTHTLLNGAVTTLLDAGARDGTLRADITPGDALLLVGSVASSAQHSTKERAHRLVELLMDALTKNTTAT
ncbi:helix-turn-helix domain-containing protein [Streptomyces sp. NPDC005566]|uniref:TetR/AcrR family transcriptional regulator n=1 Tax=Streptomyces sp. NPDC005566 TaxID=3156886 RepID=UPI0033B49626